jgi:hypothetical protein
MRQQLRLRVILPVAVLALLGAGYGAFAYGQPPEASPLPPPTRTAEAATPPAPKPKKQPTKKPAVQKQTAKKPVVKKPTGSPLERQLRSHRAVVVVFHTPAGNVDSQAVREARAAALEMNAGFLAVNAMQNGSVSALASRYDVYRAPTVVVFTRGPRIATRFDGYADRETIAQAVANARR